MKIEIPSFENTRALVVGDVMLDQYWHGNASRISPEAPVPIVQINELEERPGGAANVALNLSTLGCKVDLMGIIGKDRSGELLKTKLQTTTIKSHLYSFPDVPTISKLRIIGRNQQLIRLDFEQKFASSHADCLIERYTQLLSEVDIVVLSDYGKGTLAQVKTLIALARRQGIPVLVDPKSNDFSQYAGATLITPNLKEFEAVVGSCLAGRDIEHKGFPLLNAHQFEAILVTRSEHGMTLLQKGHNSLHLPTRAREVYDVSGAGDTVISVLAASVAAGLTLDTAAMLANTAAGVVVQKLGTATVSLPELRRAWQRQHDSEMGILTEAQLIVAIADARAHGETIVMTNGCFDILHTGHVTYLEQAKELGQRLIIAVNDDASVARLKGSNRPINSLRDRMMVLAALRAVDWVVSFSEDTPERIIKQLNPDILVKGGDYRVEDIAGSDFVLSKGGQVKVLGFVRGYSTSSLIKKTQESLPLGE
jgi:D-beta-D-heptose 7-phosphate kinase/D-beta-D-heptose 1-phosphate adenosyltransferase